MTRTLTPHCPFCGLRFGSRPLLELHIREDHLHRDPLRKPDQRDPNPRPSGQQRDGPARHDQPTMASRTQEAVTVSDTRRPRKRGTGWAAAAVRRTASAFRHANAELLLASEALFRPAGAQQPPRREDPPASGHTRPATSDPADRAA